MGGQERREQAAVKAIRKAWPGTLGRQVLDAIGERSEAFGALAWHLDLAAEDGQDPVALLRALNRRDVRWAAEDADDPAAYLASRVR